MFVVKFFIDKQFAKNMKISSFENIKNDSVFVIVNGFASFGYFDSIGTVDNLDIVLIIQWFN